MPSHDKDIERNEKWIKQIKDTIKNSKANFLMNSLGILLIFILVLVHPQFFMHATYIHSSKTNIEKLALCCLFLTYLMN